MSRPTLVRTVIVTALVIIACCNIAFLYRFLATVLDGDSLSLSLKGHAEEENSATGYLFLGDPFRSFKGERLFQSWRQRSPLAPSSTTTQNKRTHCTKWSVVTTIFPPSEAVERAASLPEWCLVIVSDTKTPKDYLQKAAFNGNDPSIHFLSVEEQHSWASSSSPEVNDFVQLIPYKHFARKNIGYLYAIRNGARYLFDFDDDNILKTDESGQLVSPISNETHLENVRIPLMNKIAMNPYPLMGASIAGSYPRGFPLEMVLDNATQGIIAFEGESISMEKIAVMQFCADLNPDVDAIHRITKGLIPMSFNADGTPLMIPLHAHTPYNAQATIHTQKALWATLLPFTVPGRVSDIWRAYFSKALFRELDLNVAFLPPKVAQDRNAHNNLADMRAELDLYFKGGKLVEYLDTWTSTAATIPERMEALWIDLYERGYIESMDVQLVQAWLQALVDCQYEFPRVKKPRHANIVLMGQFNWANSADDVSFWHQKWREVFPTIVARGPWNNSQLEAIKSRGILAFESIVHDGGGSSPMSHLSATLREFRTSNGIDGVLYVHDDAYINVTELCGGRLSFPTNAIIASADTRDTPFAYMNTDPRNVSNVTLASKDMYSIQRDGTFQKPDGKVLSTAEELLHSLRPWVHFGGCISNFQKLITDKRSEAYKQPDGSFNIPSLAPGDFMFIPMSLADAFTETAQLVVDYNLFLECGFPTIVEIVRMKENATVRTIELCTDWGGWRNNEHMLENCMSSPTIYGMYHPFKISRGLRVWGRYFDTITFDTGYALKDEDDGKQDK